MLTFKLPFMLPVPAAYKEDQNKERNYQGTSCTLVFDDFNW
jgi:hypothetical protein